MFLYRAQSKGVVARRGPYRLIRQPQYLAFIVIMYIKLATLEERDSIETFGEEYASYSEQTGRFFPNMRYLVLRDQRK